MRGIFIRVLAVSKIGDVSGTCLWASILLQQSLEKFGECEAVVRGGEGYLDGGAIDPSGVWHGHYWVEGVSSGGAAFVVDIAADQFGWPPVVVMSIERARERYRPGEDRRTQETVDDELGMMKERFAVS
ncbi:hypothetical protein CY652_10050 [Burkholderia sp. WAC0059]|nr:hypothetical protein CY652_10050 [Burkholderia sp. WAC0059]